jgi:predicted amidophosphoribosyltransferase
MINEWICHDCWSVTVSKDDILACDRCGSSDGHDVRRHCLKCADKEASDAMAGRFDDEVRRMRR